MLNVTSTPVELIDDDTATTYYNDLDTLEGAERDSRADALRLWAEQKKSDQKREQFDAVNKIYSDFDGYVNEAGLQDFDEDSRYNIANRQFIASQFEQTPEEQQETYPSFRDKWTESVAGKNGMSEKETFGLIKQGIDARNEVTEAANQIPGDIALSLFDSIGGGDPVDVPNLIETWKTKNAESIKKLPKGWETPLLESAQAFHTETEGMLRDYAEPLKKVYDHFSAVTGRDTERAGETNPKNEEEMNSMVDTLASMPKPVRERAYASVVLGAKKAGQDPKTFMEQWGESWSRTLNMVRTGALTAQEMAAESDLRMLENKETPPDYFISKSTGEKIPLANSAFHDEADLRKVTPEEIATDASKARQKVKRFEIIRELKNVADNQFDPIEKINKGGFLGFMESMAYGSPQGLAYTATALVPFVGPYLAGAAIFSDEYDQLRSQGMNVDQAIQVGSVSAAIQAGLERTGAKALFGKLPVFEKLMRKIGNPARVGKAGSAGVRFLAAATGEQLVEGAQDLTTPLVQDVAEALGADVPDVKWQPILEKWEGSRLDVLAASLPTIFFGTGVASFADNKRFAQFEERQDIYRMTGMDDAAIKKIEDGKDLAEVQQNFQSEFGKLTPENVKAGVAYIEGKITSAQEQQQNPNTHTLTRETLADGSKKFVIRDPKGEVKYTTEDAQSAQIAISELLRNQITGTTRGIFESISFFNQMNEVAGRGEDVQKFLLSDAPRNLLTDYEANPTEQNLNNLFETVRSQGQDINEPAELANFPVLASNQGTLVEGVFRSIIQIQDGATGDKVVRDFSQDNLKRAISEGRITMDWVRENLNQIIPLIESERNTGPALRTETDTDVIESFSDVALAYMTGRIREEQIPEGFRGFLRRMAIVVKDIFRRAYNLKRAIAEGKVDANFESFLADSVGLNQQARVDTASQRVAGEVLADTDGKVVFSRAQAQTNAGEIRASNATITGPANYSIAAFHGTPHKVDRFSTAKIGTGEGAQAWGWGLYFAQAFAIANHYKRVLSGWEYDGGKVTFDNNPPVNAYVDASTLTQIISNKNETLATFLERLDDKIKHTEENGKQSKWPTPYGSEVFETIPSFIPGRVQPLSELRKLRENVSLLKEKPGNLYTVDLDVEPEDLLDWDKPISEQSEKVQKALQSVSDNWLWKDAISGKGGERVGGALYSTLRATFPDAEFSRDGVDASKKASEALLAAGIPGIRYLDGSSRSEGIGTSNYVVFDENLIRITEENGNRIPASQALAQPVSTDTNYSIESDMVVENGRAYSPIVRDLLQRRAAGEDIPRSVIDQAISDNFPAQLVEPPKAESELPSRATIDDAINEGQRRDQIAKSNIQPGEAVTIRQDVPAMTRKGVGVVTIKGKSGNSYDAAARISDPQFILNEKKSLEIGMGGAKGPHIAIRGKWSSDQSMPPDLSEWTQVGFNPDRHSFYYDRATMKQVVGGSEAYQIGNTVFVKDAQFGDGQISNISYSIGKKNRAEEMFTPVSSSSDVKGLRADKNAWVDGGYTLEGADSLVAKYYKPERYSKLPKDAILVPVPSTSGRNILPERLAASIAKNFGQPISFDELAVNTATKQSKHKLDFWQKLEDPVQYKPVFENIAKLRAMGRPIIIVEDVHNTGESWMEFARVLRNAGIDVQGVATLATTDARITSPRDIERISQKVSSATNRPLDEVLPLMQSLFSATYKQFFNKAEQAVSRSPKDSGRLVALAEGRASSIAKSNEPRAASENASTRGARGIASSLSSDTNYSIGIDRNAISQVSEKDDASRVGTSKLGTAKVPKNTPQESNISGDNVPDELLASQMAKVTYAHLPKAILSETNPQKKRRKLINWFKKNLLALHDAFPEGVRARATHWYDGANRIAKELGNQFQASVEQASGVIAVFSPQKDWFMNVAQAEQFIELWTNSQDVVLEESLVRAEIEGIIEAATAPAKQNRKKVDGETKEQTAERREYNKALDERAKVDRRKKVEQVIGKTIRQLDAEPDLQGWAIRVLAQITFGRNYRNLSPEGDRLGMASNDDGALSKNGWGSINEIEKAVRIMKDGSLKNISDNLGNEHKVRNFYNNIVAPNTPYGDATIDTHAVAAAHLMPYGAKATEVGHNFGSGMNGSEVLGISGVYHLYLDAYREAAADRGILPRQMQSITWEAIRLVYPAATKNATTLAKSQKTWKDLTDDSARNTLVGGRIPSPVWAGANDNGESQSNPTGMGENIGQEGVSGGGLLSGVRPTGAGRDGGVNYSIASQSEIDRVNKALGGMNRGPDERLKVYQRAKAKFSKLMAWNSDELAAMADTGSDDSQIRRTQILQALGELDGILSVLPPEVRGRVGGYTKLAGIAPHDVLKDGVKVSEVSGMNGAIISAWMDQGLNIGQAGKQVSLPPGYTATENLSTKRADKVIADFFRDRIKRMDTELEKVLVREYTEAITKVVKQSRPKAGDNGVRKSTLGAETQKFADTVLRATLLDDEATAKRMAEIEAALTMPDATAEDISALSEEWSILNTFGDLDNRSSETLAQGLDWLKGQFQMGREAWRIKEQARIDEQRARNAATIEWLGKGTAKKRFADKGLMQRIGETANNYLLDHASFEQFVSAFLPQEIASNFSERLRKADMAAQSAEIRDGKGILDAVRAGAKAANMSAGEAMLWLKADQKNAVSYLEGRKVKDERIAIDLAQKIVTGEADRSKLTEADVETLRNELAALPADTQKEFVTIKRVIFRGEDVKLDMSRAKAMQLLLSWNQPDVQIKMRKEGWTDDSAADLNALVNDPVSRKVMAYAKELYGKGAGIVNPVYSRMFGMNMPQVKNYAPTRFINAKDSKDVGIDGSPSATGTTPGFAKSRVTHSAKIAPEDALTVMQGHIAQQAHWVHFAELAREFRAILSNPEVRESLKQTHGDGVLKSAELWADQLEQRGGNKAKEIAWFNPILGTVLSGKAVSSLGFNLKTLAMQLDNTVRFGLALDMRQIVSALSNPSKIVEDIQTVWESDALQNRLQGGATAEARFLFSRYAGKPNFAAKIAEASMTPINWLDSAGTSISSAIVYRANLNDALAAGMPEQLAKQTALDAASQAIYRFAQPVSFGQKSIVENNANVMGKMFFLFMSDARLKTAILADAARGLATGSGDKGTHMRRILAIETMAVLSHVVSSAFRDGLSDDDDEEIWNLGGFAKAMLLAPLQGYFFAGTLGELAISKLTGQKTFNSTTQNPLLSAMEQAARAGNNLEDALNLDDPDAMTKEWNNIFRSMALSPAMAAPAVLLNMVKPVMGLYENATTED